ncbi:Peroxisomal membrane protein PMP27 [Myotisia sp. PD_48]|nr:Peroxisomal membrane protein PMP27 [Myotisia sp. PD_48]
MVADALTYHPLVSHYVKFIATTAGRDKVLRTLQYFARFVAWYLFRTNYPQSSINPFEAIKKQFALTRKILRFGKGVEHFKAAAVALDSKPGVAGSAGSDPVLKYLAVGRQLGYAVYLTYDSVLCLDSVGIRKIASAQKLQTQAVRAWFAGLTCSAIAGVYTLWKLNQLEKTVNKKEGEGAVEGKKISRERAVACTQLVSDCCDLTIPLSALGLVNLDDGIVGIAGTISSLIGLKAVWRKTA